MDYFITQPAQAMFLYGSCPKITLYGCYQYTQKEKEVSTHYALKSYKKLSLYSLLGYEISFQLKTAI